MSFSATIITLFPEAFPGLLGISVLGKALEKGAWSLDVVNLRDFAHDAYKSVDDMAFGGGPGMVLRPNVVDEALTHVTSRLDNPRLIYFSPRGQTLNQKMALSVAQDSRPLVLLCGRYEGIDERLFDLWPLEEISIGDYILTGGEAAAMVFLESALRYVPHVLGDEDSSKEESFSEGLLEYPHYTRPRSYKGHSVPDVLLSGHHGHIQNWRNEQSRRLTQERRPDLWKSYENYVNTNPMTK